MPKLKEDRIKSRFTRQSTNIQITNQDEAYVIELFNKISGLIKRKNFYIDFSIVKHTI